VPAGYEARPATLDDLPAIDELFVASDVVLGVRPEPPSAYLGWRWSQPYVDVERDTRVLTTQGRIVGFSMGFVEHGAPSVTRCMGGVHPEHVGRGLGGWLVGFFERHARSIPGVVTTRLGITEQDAAGHALVRAAGYLRVRSSFDMGAPLEVGLASGIPPEGVTIRPFVAGEERLVWRLEVEAFRDHWDHEDDPPYEAFHGDWFGDPAGPPVIWIAELDGRPVGEVAWIASNGVPYVFSVAVLREARRRGIATALLRHAMAAAVAEGHPEMTLSVDAESPTGAVRVYDKVGMSVHRTTAIYERGVA